MRLDNAIRYGQFHSDNTGVFHFGLERDMLRRALMDTGFQDIREATAARVLKDVAGGAQQKFSIFLICGRV